MSETKEAAQRRADDGILSQLIKAWPLIVATAALIYTWALFTGSLGRAERDIDDHESRIRRIEEVISAMASMREDVSEIKRYVFEGRKK